MVIEVMGRHTGWIATVAGLAGGADCILIPEQPMTIQEVAETIRKRHNTGKTFSIVVVAEGFMPTGMDVKYEKEKTDDFDHTRLGGIGNLIGQKLEELTNIDTRVTILGHVQRGGTPTAYDRVLATRFGVKAVDMVVNGDFGKMAALKGSEIVPVSLEEVAKGRKTVNMELYEIAKVFFG
jgi:6-phosphofructokinase 1